MIKKAPGSSGAFLSMHSWIEDGYFQLFCDKVT